MATSTSIHADLPQLTVEDFRRFIDKKANERSKHIFKNGNTDNANIVAANIFKHSKTIRIYADNMDGRIGDCQPDYYREAIDFLSRQGTTLEIVLDKVDEQKSNAFKYFLNFRKLHPEKLRMFTASEQFQSSVRQYKVQGSNDLHFMVGDADKFRLEYNKETKSAYFSFSNTDITKPLITAFDANVKSCDPLL